MSVKDHVGVTEALAVRGTDKVNDDDGSADIDGVSESVGLSLCECVALVERVVDNVELLGVLGDSVCVAVTVSVGVTLFDANCDREVVDDTLCETICVKLRVIVWDPDTLSVALADTGMDADFVVDRDGDRDVSSVGDGVSDVEAVRVTDADALVVKSTDTDILLVIDRDRDSCCVTEMDGVDDRCADVDRDVLTTRDMDQDLVDDRVLEKLRAWEFVAVSS